jgi:DNA-directed RNA polymerase specialized sigma24 family protein
MAPLDEGSDMPRISPYSITLAEAERKELEARARRYTSPYSDVMRARIVLYAAEGLGNDEIAARLGPPLRRHRAAAGRVRDLRRRED